MMSAYQVLARKWRPKTFADLVGQQHVVKALQNALDKGRLHHAYLLTGTRGVGKTTIARILAKSLNCEHPHHGEPCGECQSCRDIDAGRFVDLLEIDAASNTGIDNIREVLENAQYAPTAGKYKVYIIDEVHMLSKSAFNAMLKTLEEPPEHVKFILATTDPHKVPITVLSRCLQFVLRNMTAQQVTEHLTHVLKSEQIIYEPAALALLGRAAQGSMRDALSLLDQAIAMGSGSVKESDVRDMIGAVDKRYLYELLTYLMEQDGEQLIAKAQEMAANAIGFDSALNELAMLLQRLALLKTVPSAIDHDDPERERLLHLSQYFSDEQIQLYYQCAIHGKQDLPLAPDEYAGFVMTLLRMLAFAPFAAKHTPPHSTIEGTQLHNPPEKKSDVNVIAPPKPSDLAKDSDKVVQKQFRPQDLPPPHREDIRREAPDLTPPWEDLPTDDVNQAEILENENAETTAKLPDLNISGSLNDVEILENVNADTTTELPNSNISGSLNNTEMLENENADTTTKLPDSSISGSLNDTEMLENENADTTAKLPNSNFSGSLNTENTLNPNVESEPMPPYFNDLDEMPSYDRYDDGYIPFEALSATPPYLEDDTPEEDEQEPEPIAPHKRIDKNQMPEFKKEHWIQIAAQIGSSVAAAQMVLNHLAWVDFQNGVLHLALMEEKTKNSVKDEYFDRISAILSEVYELPVTIKTQAWQDGHGWETPAMYRERIAHEQRETARSALNADAVAQQLVQLFDGKWVEDSVVLTGN